MDYTIALFGKAERGEFRTAYYCKTLEQLSDFLGEPPHRITEILINAELWEEPPNFNGNGQLDKLSRSHP